LDHLSHFSATIWKIILFSTKQTKISLTTGNLTYVATFKLFRCMKSISPLEILYMTKFLQKSARYEGHFRVGSRYYLINIAGRSNLTEKIRHLDFHPLIYKVKKNCLLRFFSTGFPFYRTKETTVLMEKAQSLVLLSNDSGL
jgi:hypothetical protein